LAAHPQISGNRLQIQQRSLYLALYHLERRTHRERGESGNKRKAKWYRLTAGGRWTLQAKIKNWNSMAEVIAGVLNAQPEKL